MNIPERVKSVSYPFKEIDLEFLEMQIMIADIKNAINGLSRQ